MITATHWKSKIGMLDLLKLCKKYGVDDDGVNKISELTGLKKKTINQKINEYCIIPNLDSGLID